MKHFNEIRSMVQQEELPKLEFLNLCLTAYVGDPEVYMDKIYPYISSFSKVQTMFIGSTNDVDEARLWQKIFPCTYGLVLMDIGLKEVPYISDLTHCRTLNLGWNKIRDISCIAPLTNMLYLNLDNNQIEDISCLANMTKLKSLTLDTNQVSDISVLRDLPCLHMVDLDDNPVSNPEVVVNHPNVKTLYMNGETVRR